MSPRRPRPAALTALVALLLLAASDLAFAGEAVRVVPQREKAQREKPRGEKPVRRSFLQRLRPFKKTSIIVSVGVSAGPYIGGVSSNLGLCIRGRDSELPQGLFWQNGVDLGFVGAKRISSPVKEFRGWERNVGPRSVNHPIYGDRVGFPIIPDVLSISASRTGGLGVGFSIPVLGAPFSLVRIPISVYVASPGLARVGGKVNDGMDALTRTGARLVAPVVQPVKKALRPIARPIAKAARASVAGLKRWVDRDAQPRRAQKAPASAASAEITAR